MDDVESHRRRLVGWHYALAAFTAAFAIPGAYVAWLGKPLLYPVLEVSQRYRPRDDLFDPYIFGALLTLTGAALLLLAIVHGTVVWYVGRCLARQRRRGLIWAVTIFDLMYVPFGTALSLYALVVLNRMHWPDETGPTHTSPSRPQD